MTALDLGCGPGYFTIEMSRLAGNPGKVIAADLQDGMLGIVRQKIKKYGISNIELYKCGEGRIGLQEKADFILVFWMLHEIPDQQAFLLEIKTLLNPGGKVLIAEPRFHVSKNDFKKSIDIIHRTGFETSRGPGIFFSRTILLKNS
jgi:ubiquinone/menaquinone biosynthesis C-methylase UbiE